jgi:hypothetical protein
MAIKFAEIIGAYATAYEAANGKPAPKIKYEQGWFIFLYDTGYKPRYRAAKLIEMGERLLRTAAEAKAGA